MFWRKHPPVALSFLNGSDSNGKLLFQLSLSEFILLPLFIVKNGNHVTLHVSIERISECSVVLFGKYYVLDVGEEDSPGLFFSDPFHLTTHNTLVILTDIVEDSYHVLVELVDKFLSDTGIQHFLSVTLINFLDLDLCVIVINTMGTMIF